MRACSEGLTAVKRGRLAVLGAGGDGKTSFIDRLTGRGFNKAHIVTDGLEAELSCTVDTVNCTEAWTEHRMDQAQVLQDAVTSGLYELMEEFQQLESDEYGNEHLCWQGSGKRKQILQSEISQEITSSTHSAEANESEKSSITHSDIDPETQRQLEQVHIESKRQAIKDLSDIEVMDFGGQWMYKTIHHIFIRNKCVFALVINLNIKLDSLTKVETKPKLLSPSKSFVKWFQTLLSKSQTIGRVPYIEQIVMWLNTILSHMKTSEIGTYLPNTIIIGTHKDLLGWTHQSREKKAAGYFEELKELLKSKAHKQMIRGYYAIDNKHGDPETFREIRKEIVEAIVESCDWNQKRPIKWLQMEKHLHDLKGRNDAAKVDKNLIPFGDACKYGEKFQIHPDDMEAFCNFHHMRGDITYLQTEALKGYLIANPQWLVNVFRAIITLPIYRPTDHQLQDEIQLLENDGILKTKGAFLKNVWQQFLEGKEDAQQRIDYLIHLLVHFDITCPLKEDTTADEGLYLVPCLLPWCLDETEPDPDWMEVLPAVYFRFHNSKDSFHTVHLDTTPVDLFLPFAFFQRLVCRCSKQQGWPFTSTKYQNMISFLIGDKRVILQTHFQSVWIKLNILIHRKELESGGFLENVASSVYSAVTKEMNALMECYHRNMWYEVCLSPCENSHIQTKARNQTSSSVFEVDECLCSTGVNSMNPNASLRLVQCKLHKATLPIKYYEAWFKPSQPLPSQSRGRNLFLKYFFSHIRHCSFDLLTVTFQGQTFFDNP